MKVWLSQNSHSSAITPFSQRPMVAIVSLNALPVGGIVLPSPIGIGCVKVPSITLSPMLPILPIAVRPRRDGAWTRLAAPRALV